MLSVQLLVLLLEKGANIHAENDEALRRESINGHLEVVAILKEHIQKVEPLKNVPVQE